MRENAVPDIYASITTQVLEAMEKGTIPWVRPWDASPDASVFAQHQNVASGKPYRGINTLLLWMAGRCYRSTIWGTFRQWNALGGRIKKGEKATRIVFFQESLVEDKETSEAKRIMVLREYSVFNAEQVGCIDQAVIASPPLPILSLPDRDPHLDAWFKRVGAIVRIGGAEAFYMQAHDFIAMPDPGRFRSVHDWYATLAHEHAHWTGHATRLDRLLSGWKASPEYAFEELVAELSSAFTCARLGVALGDLQHAQYVASWCRGMQNHKSMIVSAASAAQRATDFLFQLAGEPENRVRKMSMWVCDRDNIRIPGAKRGPGRSRCRVAGAGPARGVR